MLPIFDLDSSQGRDAFDACREKLRATTSTEGEAWTSVSAIIDDVRRRGDDAVVRYMQKWTDPAFTHDRICVAESEIRHAADRLDPELRAAIGKSIDHVRGYQQHIKPASPPDMKIDGAALGLRFVPVERAGLMVPGGSAVLFSTLIMLAVPAQVAGVASGDIAVVNPPPTRQAGRPVGDISPVVLATCHMLGLRTVYRMGGAQAVAALAFGTDRVKRVEMIAGPGNVFVQLAKSQLSGQVGTDGGFYGPSEIVAVADETADARRVAADLIAQAEHDPGKCFLVAWSIAVIDQVIAQIEQQLAGRARRPAIEAALRNESCALLASGPQHAIDVVNMLAAEHVSLAVADPDALFPEIRNAGEIFLGDNTPVAAGDYYAGPSHCLPTGTTARFASGVSVHTFLKRMGTVAYARGMDHATIEAIARLAEAEGLDGHAASARARGRGAAR